MRLAAALVLLSCASSEHRLSFPEATPEAFLAAQMAAYEWAECPGVDMPLSRAAGGVLVVVVPARSLGTPHIGVTRTHDDEPTLVQIDERYATVRRIYAHEFGHVLGREHSDHGVMSTGMPDAHVAPEDCP